MKVYLVLILAVISVSAEMLKVKDDKHEFSLRSHKKPHFQYWRNPSYGPVTGTDHSAKKDRVENFSNVVRKASECDFLWENKRDFSKMAPILMTNYKVHNHKNEYEYIWLWEDDKTKEDAPWHYLEVLEHVDRIAPLSNYFKVKSLTPEEALEKISTLMKHFGKKAVMFNIHGWNHEVYHHLCDNYNLNSNTNYLTIPLTWHVDRGLAYKADYRYDRADVAPYAGLNLANEYKPFFSKVTQSKSWMCHSMGCYVTQHFLSDVVAENDIVASSAEDCDSASFKDIFLVAPDVRYDLFNEWPLNSGEDKNECKTSDEWKTGNLDCRLGGGEVLKKMARDAVLVYWNSRDYAGIAREERLKIANWPISKKGLLLYGDTGVKPKEEFAEKVTFKNIHNIGAKHLYQADDFMVKEYKRFIYDGPCGVPEDVDEVVVNVKKASTCPADVWDDNDAVAVVYLEINGEQRNCGQTTPVSSQNPVWNQKISCGIYDVAMIQAGFKIGFVLYDSDDNTSHDRLGGLTFDKSLTGNYAGDSFTLKGGYDCNWFRHKESVVYYGVELVP